MTLKFKITKAMKKIFSRNAALIMGLLFSCASITQAQNNNVYAWPDTAICQGASVTLNVSAVPAIVPNSTVMITPIGDDQRSRIVSLPLPFTLYGNIYNQCMIGSNGEVGFNTVSAGGYNPWPINVSMPSPTPLDLRNTIMGPWQDNHPPLSGSIRVGTFGTAPNRIFVAEWDDIPMYACNQSCIGNEIQLYETSNIIEIHIAAKNLCATWNQGRAIEGLNNATGTIAHIVPGRNCCTQWTAFQDAYRFTPSPGPTWYTVAPTTFLPRIFVASTNINITWLLNGNPVGNGPTLNVSPVTTSNYIAQVSYTSCGNYSFSDTVTVTVSPPFTLNFNPIVNVLCFGGSTGSATINASANAALPLAYLWSTTPPETTATGNSLNANTYTVTVTDNGGCIVSASVTITEPPDLIVTPDPPTNVQCFGQGNGVASVTVNGGVAPYAYLWSNGANSNPNTSLGGNTYTVTVTDANGCTKTASVTVTEPTQLVINPTTSQTICIGTSLNLCPNESGGTPGYTYLWSDGSMTQCINVSPAISTIYTVTVTDANNCIITSSPIFITVNPPLTVTAVVNDPDICVGTQVFLSAVGVSGGDGNYSYNWIPGIGSTAGPLGHSPVVTTNYTVIVTDGCGTPAATDTVTVVVNPLPLALFSGTNLSGCVPFDACFQDLSNVSTGSITQWLWDFGDGSSGAATQNPCHTYTSPSSPNLYNVTLSVTSNAGCSQSFTINNYVDAHPVTTAYFTMYPKFTTLAEPNTNFDASGDPLWIYHWSFGDGYSDTSQSVTHPYTAVGKYQVCLYTTNTYNCADTLCDSVDVRADFSFYVPNAFTPNHDLVNEVFTPMGRSFQEYDLTIYDRWGTIIFRSKDIRFSWDGKLSNGDDAPTGMYIYNIDLRDLDGVKHNFIGNVALIR